MPLELVMVLTRTQMKIIWSQSVVTSGSPLVTSLALLVRPPSTIQVLLVLSKDRPPVGTLSLQIEGNSLVGVGCEQFLLTFKETFLLGCQQIKVRLAPLGS